MNLSEALSNPELRDRVAEVWQKYCATAFPGGSADLMADSQAAVTLWVCAQAAGDTQAAHDARMAIDACLLTQLDRVDAANREVFLNLVTAALGLIRNQIPLLNSP